MLCYRCGSHVPDSSEKCASCGQELAAGGVRHATGTFSRRKLIQSNIDGAPFAVGDSVLGRFQIRDVVGAGPLGFVFRAQDKDAGGEVALKAIQPRLLQTDEERRHFSKAMRLARTLSHPHVVRVMDEGTFREWPFVTMQFLEGLSLRKIIDLRLAKQQFFSLSELMPLFSQVVSALESIHISGPHSDLKPQNVLVLPDLLKVTDVGMALAMPRKPFIQALRARKEDAYLAPEFLREGAVDLRVDIFALGVILGEMVAGQKGADASVDLNAVNPAVPPSLVGVYRKAIHENPASRFTTVNEFFGALSEVVERPDSRMGQVRPPTPPPDALLKDALSDLSMVEDETPPVLPPAQVAAVGRAFPRKTDVLPAVEARLYKSARQHPKRALGLAIAVGIVVLSGLGFGALLGSWAIHAMSKNEARTDSGKSASTTANGGCPTGMVLVPEGTFSMGTSSDDPDRSYDERDLGSVLVKAFCIDVYEFPNALNRPPRAGVSFNEAANLCASLGKRLCREEEWEKACKGPKNLRFPYGDVFDDRLCNTEPEDTDCSKEGAASDGGSCLNNPPGDTRTLSPSGQWLRCRSGYGVFDLSGNVAEWTSTPYFVESGLTIKGSNFNRKGDTSRCSARKIGTVESRDAELGVRCCSDLL